MDTTAARDLNGNCGSTCEPEHPGGLHPNLREAEAIREVFRRYAAGTTTLSQLAEWLNDQGFRTRNRHWVEDGFGNWSQEPRLFTTASVKGILHNPFYAGKIKHRDQILPGVHEPLVSEQLFDAVQVALKRNSGRSETLHPRPEREYLLRGLIRCAHCLLPKSRTQLHKGTASGHNGSSPSGDPSAWGAPWLGSNSTPLTSLVLPILMPPRRCSGPSSRGRRLNNI